MSRSLKSAAQSAASLDTPRRSPSINSRPRRGETGKRSNRRPSSDNPPAGANAPSNVSSSRALSTRALGGSARNRSSSGSETPAPCNIKNASESSLRTISGGRGRGGFRSRPSCTSAARGRAWCAQRGPARCTLDARLTGSSASVGSPLHGEWLATRASPESITTVTPSTVTEDSATFVASTTLRCWAGSTARACSAIGRSPCSGRTKSCASFASASSAVLALRISPAPGKKTSTSPVGSSCTACRTALTICFSSGRSSDFRQKLDADREHPAFAAYSGTITQKLRHRLGIERGAHHQQLQIRSRRPTQSVEQDEQQVGRQMTLVKLVQDHRAHRAQGRVGEQATQHDALRRVANTSACAAHFLEAHAVPNPFAQYFSALVRDSFGSHARCQTTRLRHQHLCIAEPALHCPRYACGLASTRWGLEHDRARGPERALQLGQNIVDRQHQHAKACLAFSNRGRCSAAHEYCAFVANREASGSQAPSTPRPRSTNRGISGAPATEGPEINRSFAAFW